MLIVFLVVILVFTLQIYIGKKSAVILSVLFVAGAGWYLWHGETYMTVEDEFDSLYGANASVSQLEITNIENQSSIVIEDERLINEVLSDLGDVEGKRAEHLSPGEFEYDLRFMVKRTMDDGDAVQDFHHMFVKKDRIEAYEIIEGEGHLETIQEIEEKKAK